MTRPVDYRVSSEIIAALPGMLNSCAPGVVVNFDHCPGAGMPAAIIARQAK